MWSAAFARVRATYTARLLLAELAHHPLYQLHTQGKAIHLSQDCSFYTTFKNLIFHSLSCMKLLVYSKAIIHSMVSHKTDSIHIRKLLESDFNNLIQRAIKRFTNLA